MAGSTSRTLNESSGGATAVSLRDRVRALKLPDEPPPVSNTKLPWILTVLFAGAAAWLAYDRQQLLSLSQEKSLSSASGSNETPSEKTSNVATPAPVSPSGPNDIVLESKGNIIPAHQILVSPLVSGRILKVFFEEGNRVKKGEVLAQIETTEYKAEVDRNEAQLQAATQRLHELERGNRPEEIEQTKAELDEALAQLTQLQEEHRRNQRLRTTKVVSEREFEQSESSYKMADRRVNRLTAALKLMKEGPRKERIESARADVKQVEAELVRSRWRLENCTVRAPVSGTILKKNAEEGNIVNPVAFNGSFSLCDIADLSDLEVELSVQERELSRVFKGQTCRVTSDAYPGRQYLGQVSRLMPIADRSKGALPVRVKLTVPPEEEGMYLRPEMSVVVAFYPAERKSPADGNQSAAR